MFELVGCVARASPMGVGCVSAMVNFFQGSVILAKTLSIRYYTYYIILGINTTGIMGL